MYGNGWLGHNGCGMGFTHGYSSMWHMIFMIGVVLIVIAVVVFVRSKSSKTSQAIEQLKMLYVKGEITEEEYLKRKTVIERK